MTGMGKPNKGQKRGSVLYCYTILFFLLYKHDMAKSYINKGILEFFFDQIT
jgi:hypothetical protein